MTVLLVGERACLVVCINGLFLPVTGPAKLQKSVLRDEAKTAGNRTLTDAWSDHWNAGFNPLNCGYTPQGRMLRRQHDGSTTISVQYPGWRCVWRLTAVAVPEGK